MRAIAAAGVYAALFALVLGPWGRQGSLGWELTSLAMLMSYPLGVLVSLARALARARTGGGLAGTVPLLLLLAAAPAVPGLRLVNEGLQDRRFTRHLADIEALLTRAPMDSGRLRLPADSLPPDIRRCCVRTVFLRRDDAGQLSATVIGTHRNTYVYDPTGLRLAHGLDTGRWRSHYRVAPDWYRVIRF